MKILAVSLSVVALGGCASATVKELQANPAGRITLTTSRNYQAVYKDILIGMRECMGEGWAGAFAATHIRPALYSDLREGSISFVMSNMGVQNHYLHVDVKGIAEDRTSVDAVVEFATWKPQLERVKGWATGELVGCTAVSKS